MVLLSLMALAAMPLGSAVSNLPFTYTILEPAGIFKMYPDREASLNVSVTPRWNTSYSGSSWANFVPGMAGEGKASTTLIKSNNLSDSSNYGTVTINMLGTKVAFLGDVDDATIAAWNSSPDAIVVDQPMYVDVDYSSDVLSTPSKNGTLVEVGGLVNGIHNVELTLEANAAQTSFKGIQMDLTIQSDAPTIDDVLITTQHWTINNTRNDFFLYSGNWSIQHQVGGVGGQDPVPYDFILGDNRNTDDNANQPRTAFQVPKNTSMIVVNGTMGPTHRSINGVMLPTAVTDTILTYYSTYSPWWAKDAVIYWAILDPTVEYNCTLQVVTGTNISPDLTQGGLHSVTFWSSLYDGPQNGTAATTHKTSAGTIAGGVVGGVVGAILIGIAGYLVAKRQIRQRQLKDQKANPEEFVVDDQGEAGDYQPYASPTTEMSETSKRAPLLGAPGSIAGGSSARSPVETVRYEQAQDAGLVERVEFVPPQYNPEWASSGPDIATGSGSGSGGTASEVRDEFIPHVPHGSDAMSPTTATGTTKSPATPGGYSFTQLNQNPSRDTKGW